MAGVAGSARAAARAGALTVLSLADLVPYDRDKNDSDDGGDNDGGNQFFHGENSFLTSVPCGIAGNYFLEVLTLTASLF